MFCLERPALVRLCAHLAVVFEGKWGGVVAGFVEGIDSWVSSVYRRVQSGTESK